MPYYSTSNFYDGTTCCAGETTTANALTLEDINSCTQDWATTPNANVGIYGNAGSFTINNDVVIDGDGASIITDNIKILKEVKVDLSFVRDPNRDGIEYRMEVAFAPVAPNAMEARCFPDPPFRVMTQERTISKRRRVSKLGFLSLEAIDRENVPQPKLIEEWIKQGAREVGRELAREITHNTIRPESLQRLRGKEQLRQILNEYEIELPTKDGIIIVPIGNLVRKHIGEGEKLTFDFNEVRNIIKADKAKKKIAKYKSVNIRNIISASSMKLEDMYNYWGIKDKFLGNFSEEEVQKELKALTLLKRLVVDEEFKRYIKDKYIDIPSIKGDKVYRINRSGHIKVLTKQKTFLKEELCVNLHNPRGPQTDEVIMKAMFAKNNESGLYERSNVYKKELVLARS